MVRKFYKVLGLIALISLCNNLEAQDEFDFIKYSPKSKFGLRLGAGVSSLRGGNFLNPTPYFGYAAGFYHHGRIKRRSYFYYELSARFKGSNFNTNPDSNTYSKMTLFYTELPVAYMHRLGKDENKPFFIMAGGGGSLLLKSSMLLGPNPIPEHFDLPLKRGDLFFTTGFHKFFGSVGLQLSTKIGLTDINKNSWAGFEKVKPSPDQNKPIRNWSIEFALIF